MKYIESYEQENTYNFIILQENGKAKWEISTRFYIF